MKFGLIQSSEATVFATNKAITHISFHDKCELLANIRDVIALNEIKGENNYFLHKIEHFMELQHLQLKNDVIEIDFGLVTDSYLATLKGFEEISGTVYESISYGFFHKKYQR